MTTALYRRYRPETFGEMIGQAQVTEPLMTALRSDRVGHAYLFSGPRGCGKTTSARILARCLNCAAGPTDTPCGVCDSCVELSRGGGGSLDVVEIDAASHNGVDDARDLRERAIFAPARDRFKIFILDEAHMVTAQGFNALLKLVEEPPEHVKFIFATTEPEKVIGTIRSRTHHYPFRLVAPAAMLEYVEQLCVQEGVQTEAGVLPLVVRAGGGSPRDTLSLLDQLIAGSDPVDGEKGATVRYERAVALLGYTHGALLDEVVTAFAAHDAAAAFAAIDRVVQTGQDPRRFVDDLLERLRDLIIVAATGEGAGAVLRGIPADELERMGRQASAFGTDRLSRIADLVVGTLDDMSGATSPRLQLELLVARVLAHTAPAVAAPAPVVAAPAPAVAAPAPAVAAPAPVVAAPAPAVAAPAPAVAAPAPVVAAPAAPAPEAPTTPVIERASAASESKRPDPAPAVVDPEPTPASPASAPVAPSGPVTLAQVRDAWPEILQRLEPVSRSSWMIAVDATPVAFADDVLTLSFRTQADVAAFKKLAAGKGPSEDLRGAIRDVLGIRVKYVARFDADAAAGPSASGGAAASDDGRRTDDGPSGSARAGGGERPRSTPTVASSAAAPVTEWAVARIPSDPAPRASAPNDPAPGAPAASALLAPAPAAVGLAVDDEPEDATAETVRTLTIPRDGAVLPASVEYTHTDDDAPDEEEFPPPLEDAPLPPRAPVAVERPAPPRVPRPGGIERVGEAVVRQVLGAAFVREEPYTPPTRFN
ncbi:DNA polymerase III, subunit gamma and tau [Microbacterium sp. oral taxon 186 str. F0373]|uniref:DNA polymerase III subunit gamma and tau n=1 Tax=Microbacterium sp. oral taxon 186 TaxID=712383 RepID=UPI00034E57D8|nr:DNA polymerase III subunit gamma and tau [Microbacterium sp. oral taxon 186]EPD85032.1 DNA polymerase III, subunit gamma and tau [Microbacterium sp. oral taxon 186 str. F0373]